VKGLERTIEGALVGGLLLSAGFMAGGLLLQSDSALRWGIVLLMLTPVARVFVLTLGLLAEGDWGFGLVSFFVLAVLTLGIWVAGFSRWPHTLPFR
jgi:hypothetical protein